jgi:hypothetical protein
MASKTIRRAPISLAASTAKRPLKSEISRLDQIRRRLGVDEKQPLMTRGANSINYTVDQNTVSTFFEMREDPWRVFAAGTVGEVAQMVLPSRPPTSRVVRPYGKPLLISSSQGSRSALQVVR